MIVFPLFRFICQVFLKCSSCPELISNFSLQFFRDRLRTTTNVLGDSLGAGIVEHLSRQELDAQDCELGNSGIEEKEQPCQQVCLHSNSLGHPSRETAL